MRSEVIIHEVGLRDGLQAEKQTVPTETKLAWARAIAEARVDIIQVGSFVHPEKVPQMSDTDELFRALRHMGIKATLSGLALNEKGVERGLDCGVTLFCLGVSASETHSRKNTGMGTDDALKRIVACAREVRQSGADVQVSVQSAFGCGFEGAVPEERVLGIVRSYIDAGLTNISLADTAGHAHPHQVRRLYARVRELSTEVHCISHFHDTYGLGIANALAALESGAATFETSFAGLGGCPFTKVMAGNIPTEDLVHTFKRLGVPCRADLNRLITIARDLASHFGREMPGRVYKTGPLSY